MAKADSGSSKAGDVFDLARIRDLIALMEESNLSEVDLRQDEQQIRLVRGGVAASPAVPPAAAPAPPVATAVAAPTVVADGGHIQVIKSPMVGTFYSRSSPKAEDFVKVGSKVSADTVVCIVEAMKVFNEIPAEISGTIVEILARNEDAVDFDRPLFKVDTRG
ncbi:MAG: acetyl-CoA carboxylase biotin carboxyl carrier protein [Pirellulaceae bacterium]|jgi:acetyl-CoA carboxylase biotin carboxyl carrier protein|nr:acetyl-CoA carboxylase biotin carboxyl carrier protein [Pirellulaceae bacterium]